MKTDYTCWSPRELIERIHELERAVDGVTEKEGAATNVYINDSVRVNINALEDGRIVYQLESALFDRWVPCGNCVEYTNVPA